MRRADLLTAVWPDVLARQESAPSARAAPKRPAPRGPGGGPAPDAAERAELRRRVAASRAAQGLPPFITDEATLDKIAELLAVVLGRDTTPRGRQGAPPLGRADLEGAGAPVRGAVASARAGVRGYWLCGWWWRWGCRWRRTRWRRGTRRGRAWR